MTYSKEQLIEFFNTTDSVVSTNFPKFVSAQLKKGYLVTKIGKGISATYEVEKVEPKEIDFQQFSSRKLEIAEDLPGEIWKTTYCSPKHEVSNLGRLRKKDNKVLIKGSLHNGYLDSELIKDKSFRIHRIVKQTFDPVENPENLVVDHINGIRTDNRLENLRWVTSEENTLLMLKNREEITKETTRLIVKYGYDKVLDILRNIE